MAEQQQQQPVFDPSISRHSLARFSTSQGRHRPDTNNSQQQQQQQQQQQHHEMLQWQLPSDVIADLDAAKRESQTVLDALEHLRKSTRVDNVLSQSNHNDPMHSHVPVRSNVPSHDTDLFLDTRQLPEVDDCGPGAQAARRTQQQQRIDNSREETANAQARRRFAASENHFGTGQQHEARAHLTQPNISNNNKNNINNSKRHIKSNNSIKSTGNPRNIRGRDDGRISVGGGAVHRQKPVGSVALRRAFDSSRTSAANRHKTSNTTSVADTTTLNIKQSSRAKAAAYEEARKGNKHKQLLTSRRINARKRRDHNDSARGDDHSNTTTTNKQQRTTASRLTQDDASSNHRHVTTAAQLSPRQQHHQKQRQQQQQHQHRKYQPQHQQQYQAQTSSALEYSLAPRVSHVADVLEQELSAVHILGPQLEQQLDKVEKHTKNRLSDLHGRIQGLMDGYSALDKVAARSSFVTAWGRNDHTTNDHRGGATKKGGMYADGDGFDYEVIHAEIYDISDAKRKADERLRMPWQILDVSKGGNTREQKGSGVVTSEKDRYFGSTLNKISRDVDKYVELSKQHGSDMHIKFKRNRAGSSDRGTRRTRHGDAQQRKVDQVATRVQLREDLNKLMKAPGPRYPHSRFPSRHWKDDEEENDAGQSNTNRNNKIQRIAALVPSGKQMRRDGLSVRRVQSNDDAGAAGEGGARFAATKRTEERRLAALLAERELELKQERKKLKDQRERDRRLIQMRERERVQRLESQQQQQRLQQQDQQVEQAQLLLQQNEQGPVLSSLTKDTQPSESQPGNGIHHAPDAKRMSYEQACQEVGLRLDMRMSHMLARTGNAHTFAIRCSLQALLVMISRCDLALNNDEGGLMDDVAAHVATVATRVACTMYMLSFWTFCAQVLEACVEGAAADLASMGSFNDDLTDLSTRALLLRVLMDRVDVAVDMHFVPVPVLVTLYAVAYKHVTEASVSLNGQIALSKAVSSQSDCALVQVAMSAAVQAGAATIRAMPKGNHAAGVSASVRAIDGAFASLMGTSPDVTMLGALQVVALVQSSASSAISHREVDRRAGVVSDARRHDGALVERAVAKHVQSKGSGGLLDVQIAALNACVSSTWFVAETLASLVGTASALPRQKHQAQARENGSGDGVHSGIVKDLVRSYEKQIGEGVTAKPSVIQVLECASKRISDLVRRETSNSSKQANCSSVGEMGECNGSIENVQKKGRMSLEMVAQLVQHAVDMVVHEQLRDERLEIVCKRIITELEFRNISFQKKSERGTDIADPDPAARVLLGRQNQDGLVVEVVRRLQGRGFATSAMVSEVLLHNAQDESRAAEEQVDVLEARNRNMRARVREWFLSQGQPFDEDIVERIVCLLLSNVTTAEAGKPNGGENASGAVLVSSGGRSGLVREEWDDDGDNNDAHVFAANERQRKALLRVTLMLFNERKKKRVLQKQEGEKANVDSRKQDEDTHHVEKSVDVDNSVEQLSSTSLIAVSVPVPEQHEEEEEDVRTSVSVNEESQTTVMVSNLNEQLKEHEERRWATETENARLNAELLHVNAAAEAHIQTARAQIRQQELDRLSAELMRREEFGREREERAVSAQRELLAQVSKTVTDIIEAQPMRVEQQVHEADTRESERLLLLQEELVLLRATQQQEQQQPELQDQSMQTTEPILPGPIHTPNPEQVDRPFRPLLDWDDSEEEDSESEGEDDRYGGALSEGELDVEAGELSDGEVVEGTRYLAQRLVKARHYDSVPVASASGTSK